MTEIRVPTLGESVTEATIGKWFKHPGDAVAVDEPLVELETDKVTIEVPSPAAGVLASIAAKDGETVGVGAVLGQIQDGAAAKASTGRSDQKTATTTAIGAGPEVPQPRPQAPPPPPPPPPPPQARTPEPKPQQTPAAAAMPAPPSVRKLAAESGLDVATVPGSGKDGRVTKGDMLAAIERAAAAPTPVAATAAVQMRAPSPPDDAAREERVRMTRLRQTVARRLKDAQNTAAMLTTFNEVDMSAVMHLRSQYRDQFEKKHGVKLGFMSFFVRACVQALREIPNVNAEIDGTDIVYKNYYHIAVAVGTEKGLVVPVVRDCDLKSFAQIEKEIADYGRRAREGTLKLEELQGGTFTISNGGVYGSLMSTPILNAPQSGILGMHKIQERPVVVAGKIEVRPMMYLALSYDHRIVDGREAVTFLVRVKESLEDPARLVLDL
jgi:2-oxoglutarate dehydrogenase E2 component (dihydrolipoamide succinyltransferase)